MAEAVAKMKAAAGQPETPIDPPEVHETDAPKIEAPKPEAESKPSGKRRVKVSLKHCEDRTIELEAGEDRLDAIEKYNAMMGITGTEHKYQVSDA